MCSAADDHLSFGMKLTSIRQTNACRDFIFVGNDSSYDGQSDDTETGQVECLARMLPSSVLPVFDP